MATSDPNDNSLDPLHGFEDPAARLLWLGLAAAVVIGLVGYYARPAYRYIKLQRAIHIVAEANRMIEEQRLPEAGRRVQVALGLAPKDPGVLRVTARLCSDLEQIEGLAYWDMLKSVTPLTREDRIAYARLALRVNRLELARPLLLDLIKENASEPTIIRLVIELMERSDRKTGEVIARSLLEWVPGDEFAEFWAASYLMSHVDEVVREEARRHIWSIAIGKGPLKAEALARLSRFPNLSRPALEMLLRSINEIENPTLAVKLMKWDFSVRLSPDNRPEAVAAVMALGGPGAATQSRGAVAQWLLAHREAEAVLELLPFDDAKKAPLLLQFHLQALADLARWNEAADALAEPDLEVDPVMLYSFRAVADLRAGKRDMAQANFNNALAACKGRAGSLRMVATYSERLGVPEIAIEAWRQVMGDPEATREAAQEISRIARSMDDLQASLSAVKRLMDFEAGDPAVEKEFTYLNLMLDTRLPQADELAEKLFAAHPTEPENRMLAALSRFRRGNSAEALELLESAGVNWTNAPVRFQTVYAGVLGANNQRSAAREVARAASRRNLKPQEREFIRAWLPEPGTLE